MPDVYGNPYLPSFVRNQPSMANPVPGVPSPVLPTKASQINSVQGFDGAHKYVAGLLNGSSEILAESDPNVSRVYVVAVDQNGQRYVQGFRLIPEEEPKPVTMDDLNDKMNRVLSRLDQLEAERKTVDAKPGNGPVEQNRGFAAIVPDSAVRKQSGSDDSSDGYD